MPSSDLPSTSVPRLLPFAVVRKVGADWVLVDRRAARIIGLNESAGRTLALLDGSTSIATMAATLAVQFGVRAEDTLGDVIRFVSELKARGMVALATGPGNAPAASP